MDRKRSSKGHGTGSQITCRGPIPEVCAGIYQILVDEFYTIYSTVIMNNL